MRTHGSQKSAKIDAGPSAVPDVLAPGLEVVFCGINPGRVSAEAAAHFANPRNDFWRLLHDSGFTPRLYGPSEQFDLLELGIGITNAAYRTTKGSGELRRADFSGSLERLQQIADELRPLAIAFVGKEAFRGVFRTRPELGAQERRIVTNTPPPGDVGLFVLPSTSPANAAVPYVERLRSFSGLKTWLVPIERLSARAVVIDDERRTLLVQFREGEKTWWSVPGGGIEENEDPVAALRRELAEEIGLDDFVLGPEIWTREHSFLGWRGDFMRQRDRIWLVRVPEHDPIPRVDLAAELVADVRWWSIEELKSSDEDFAPSRLSQLLRELLDVGPPSDPIDVGV